MVEKSQTTDTKEAESKFSGKIPKTIWKDNPWVIDKVCADESPYIVQRFSEIAQERA